MNSKAIFWLVGASAVIIAAIAFFVWISVLAPQRTPQPTANNQSPSVSSPAKQEYWNSYGNSYFEFEYPEEWERYLEFYPPHELSPSIIAFRLPSGSDISIAREGENLDFGIEPEAIRTGSLPIIGGRQATRGDYGYPAEKDIYLTFISFDPPLPQAPKFAIVARWSKNDTNSRTLFDQILSTFKFFEPTDTSTWQTYRNEQYGFEFMYPDLGKESVSGTNEITINHWSARIKDYVETFRIAVKPLTPTSMLENWLSLDEENRLLINNGNFDIFSLSGGFGANLNDKVIPDGVGPQAVMLYAMPISGKYVVILFYHGQSENGFSESGFKGDITATLEKIVSTFKFFEPTDTSTWKTYRNEQYGFEVSYPADLSAGNGIPSPQYSSILDTSQYLSKGAYIGPLILSFGDTEILKNAAQKEFNNYFSQIGTNDQLSKENQTNDDFGPPSCSTVDINNAVKIDAVVCRGEGIGYRGIIYGKHFNIFVEAHDYIEESDFQTMLSTFKFIAPLP